MIQTTIQYILTLEEELMENQRERINENVHEIDRYREVNRDETPRVGNNDFNLKKKKKIKLFTYRKTF